jgi:hypothetical protein
MKFYNQQHKYYCGIDLHAKKMYICIINQTGKIIFHQNVDTDPEILFKVIFPYLDDIAIAVECIFSWYCSPCGTFLDILISRLNLR